MGSDYLLIDQVDFYLFAPFKEPIEFAEYIKTQYRNLFFSGGLYQYILHLFLLKHLLLNNHE